MHATAVDITTMDLSIFDAFPNAIISGVWEIGLCQHGTVVGNQFTPYNYIDVIIDDGANASVNSTPETLRSDMLVYAYPCQMPAVSPNKLVSAYMLHNMVEDTYFEIVDAGVGKNQHTGQIEHIELKVVQTEVVDG